MPVTVLYYIRPMLVEGKIKFDRLTNETIIIKPFPLSTWFPYDEQKYYLFSYCWQLVDGCIAASFVTYTDCLVFSLIIFPLGQIHLLNHTISNIGKYVKAIDEQARQNIFRRCVIHHKNIIW